MGMSTTNIVGSNHYPGGTDRIMRLKLGAPVSLRREPDNKYDENAVAVIIFNTKVGHLSRGFAADIAPLIDSGIEVTARRSPSFPNSCMIEITWPDETTFIPTPAAQRALARGAKPRATTPRATTPRAIPTAMKPFFPALDLEDSNG